MQSPAAIRAFQTLPGIGPSIARDLYDIGYRSVDELKDADPEAMYEKFCTLKGMRIDRCLLYAFRCAVYCASTERSRQEPELRKWWKWKDGSP